MEAHAMTMEGYRDDVKQNKQSERRKPRISIGRLALKDWPARVHCKTGNLDPKHLSPLVFLTTSQQLNDKWRKIQNVRELSYFISLTEG